MYPLMLTKEVLAKILTSHPATIRMLPSIKRSILLAKQEQRKDGTDGIVLKYLG